ATQAIACFNAAHPVLHLIGSLAYLDPMRLSRVFKLCKPYPKTGGWYRPRHKPSLISRKRSTLVFYISEETSHNIIDIPIKWLVQRILPPHISSLLPELVQEILLSVASLSKG